MSVFPSITPDILEWQLISNTQSFTSPLDKSTQTIELPGSRWLATLQYPALTETDARIMIAFLASLRGMSGRFTLFDHSHRTPAGVATGSPLVNGASQTGGTLITDGWTINTTGILKAGDYIGVNGELKLVIADANSDAGGNATLSIEPPLRASPANNAVITTDSPTGTFRLADDGQTKIQITAETRKVTLTCIEAFV